MEQAKNVAVLIYERVDALDVTGPFDVFAMSSNWGKDFNVYTVSEKQLPVNTVSGLIIYPKYSFTDCPAPDILIVPGGLGARKLIHNEPITSWIYEAAHKAEIVLSICTGALLLAKANILHDLKVTTNRNALDLLRDLVPPTTTIVQGVRYVDNGKIVTSAGVTAGIDAALHVVSRVSGIEKALETATRLEYQWHTFSERLDIRKAQPTDLDAMQHLYKEAASWIRSSTGINQWSEERFTREYLENFVRHHDMFVAFLRDELVAGFSIHWEFEEIWGEHFHEDAGYIHKLAVSRELKGKGLGKQLLDWAEVYIKYKGKSWLRLDCMAENPRLNDYYQSQGMSLCGRFDGSGWSAHLYEREIF